jgi:hypothetical protein
MEIKNSVKRKGDETAVKDEPVQSLKWHEAEELEGKSE